MRTSFIKLPSIKIILSFGILFSFLQTTFAQYWEAGVNLGTTSYLGDLQSTLLQSNTMGMHFGVWTRWNMNRYLSFEAQVNKGDIQASDSNLPAFDPNHARNLNFRSTLVEVATTAQLNLLPFDVRDHKISTPYIFAGVGAVYHNPQAELNGVYYNLKELGTEGQH
nr:hypothetical protein [Saprospiraceae bacterium]